MPLLQAKFQLHGDYGTIAPGEVFEVDEETAIALATKGLVTYWRPPRIYQPETAPSERAVITPSENKDLEVERESRAAALREQDNGPTFPIIRGAHRRNAR